MDGNQEVPAAKEIFSTAKQTVALQTRLILGGEALNPEKTDLSKATDESLIDISQQTFDRLNTASTNERSRYWQEKSLSDPGLNSFEAQKKSWAAAMVESSGEEGFTEEHAMAIYDRYFTGEGKISGIDRFVQDMIAGLMVQNQNGNFEEALNQRLPEIKKMANIFGGNSAELVEASIIAKSKLILPGKKQELIAQANEEAIVSSKLQTRHNYLNPVEDRLLRWLDQNKTLDKSKDVSRPPQSGEYYWKYRRLDSDVRIFPKELTYAKLAHDLRTSLPDSFGQYDIRKLSGIVEKQLAETQAQLDKFGLTQQELKNLSLDFVDKQVLSHYREFIQNKYKISLPATEEIQILPISGTIAKAYDKTGRGLAFVDTKYPVIFLNVDNIANSAQRIMGQSWDTLTAAERHQYFKRILTEINPHEYTHLLGDIAFWELTAKDGQGEEKELESFAGKLGLEVGKPSRGVEFEYLERGRGLMEAVTVELTQQWVKAMGKELTAIYGRPIGMRLDVPAYPGEREVLYALENLISQDKEISNDKAFEIFVRAYFTKDGFREIVQAIDDHKIGPDGKPMTRRQHFTSIIYSLMQYESEKPKTPASAANYPLTLNFIWGKLALEQKQEILTNINKLEIAPLIKNHLSTLLGSTV